MTTKRPYGVNEALRNIGGWLIVTRALPLDTDVLDDWMSQRLTRSDIDTLHRTLSDPAYVLVLRSDVEAILPSPYGGQGGSGGHIDRLRAALIGTT